MISLSRFEKVEGAGGVMTNVLEKQQVLEN